MPNPGPELPRRPPASHHAALFLPAALKPGSTCPVFDLLARLSGLQQERGQLTSLARALIPSRWVGGLYQGPTAQTETTLLPVTMASCVCVTMSRVSRFFPDAAISPVVPCPYSPSIPVCLSGSFFQLSVLFDLDVRTTLKLRRPQFLHNFTTLLFYTCPPKACLPAASPEDSYVDSSVKIHLLRMGFKSISQH